MSFRKHIDEDAFRRMWATDATQAEIGYAFKCAISKVSREAAALGLTRRAIRGNTRKFVPVPPKRGQNVAPVSPPAPTIEDRKDWPDLLAAIERAIERAKGSKMPVEAINVLSAKFKLSPSVVQGLIHAATIAPPAAIRADVKQRRGQE